MAEKDRELRFRGVRPAGRAKLARHAACRLAESSRQPARQATLKYPVGGVDDTDRADRLAAVVEDGRRRARLAEHGLLTLRRDAAVANDLELAPQLGGAQRLLGQARQRLGEQVFEDLRG